jgi:cytochrome c
LKGKGGKWDWDSMSAWLLSPKKFAPGTKMTFAGLSKPEDRANLLVYMNSQGSSLPMPAAPAAANPAIVAAEKGDAPAAGDKGENEPVLSEAQAAKQPDTKINDAGAPAVSGRQAQEKAKNQ